MPLTLLRHAALYEEHQHRYNGWRDLPIDPQRFVPAKVKALQSQHFDVIYSSDLKRCTQTIELLFGGKITPITTPLLREVQFKAEIEGKSFAQIQQLPSFKLSLLDSPSRWHHYLCEESPRRFHRRLKAFLATIPPKQNILVCSHGGAIRAMLHILKQPSQELDYLEYYELPEMVSIPR